MKIPSFAALLMSACILGACAQNGSAAPATPGKQDKASAGTNSYRVADPAEFHRAVASAIPGDTIRMTAGEWKDTKLLVFRAKGEPGKPIVLTAERAGETKLTGETILQLTGEYLVVDGLWFDKAYSPYKVKGKSNLIEFKDDEQLPASHSTVRHCVFTDCNHPEGNLKPWRQWVDLYGTHNTLEYCYFEGKTDKGTMLSVEPSVEGHTPEHHVIRRNYFAHRPPLRRNGGEILRIAQGHTQMLSTHVIVEDNYFERCDGESETISVKSSDNIVRRNMFFECAGGVSLRHGQRNDVCNNYFVANGKPGSSGVKVHYSGHRIYNNLFYKIAGNTEYGATIALVAAHVNPGVYENFKVTDVEVANNTMVDCALPFNFGRIQESRKLFDQPENIRVLNNVIHTPGLDTWFISSGAEKNATFRDNLLVLKDERTFDGKPTNADIRMIEGRGFGFPVAGELHVTLPPYVATDITGAERTQRLAGALENLRFPFDDLPSAVNCGPRWFRK